MGCGQAFVKNKAGTNAGFFLYLSIIFKIICLV